MTGEKRGKKINGEAAAATERRGREGRKTEGKKEKEMWVGLRQK